MAKEYKCSIFLTIKFISVCILKDFYTGFFLKQIVYTLKSFKFDLGYF